MKLKKILESLREIGDMTSISFDDLKGKKIQKGMIHPDGKYVTIYIDGDPYIFKTDNIDLSKTPF